MGDQQSTVKRYLPWLMWGLGALFYFYENFLQVSVSVIVDDLMRELHVSASQMGNLSAFYLYPYAILQIPVGILVDRYGPRRLLTSATVICALGAILFGMSHTFAMAAAGRFMMGFGSAFAAVSCMQIAASWLPLGRFALLTGSMLTIGMLGSFAAQGPLATIIPHLGWRNTIIAFGIFGILLAAIIYAVLRDRKVSDNLKTKKTLGPGLFAGFKHVFKNKQIWITSIYGGLMFLPVPGFAGLWGVTFLMQYYHIERMTAAYIVSMIFIGFSVGAPLLGWFSDRIGRRKVPMYIGSIGALTSIYTILYVYGLPLSTVAALFFAFGFFISGFLPVFSIARESNPPETNATALGFVNMLNTLGGAATQLVIGILLDLNWTGEMEAGIRLYDADDYHFALSILPISIAISLIFLFFLKETYCKQLTSEI